MVTAPKIPMKHTFSQIRSSVYFKSMVELAMCRRLRQKIIATAKGALLKNVAVADRVRQCFHERLFAIACLYILITLSSLDKVNESNIKHTQLRGIARPTL